ncbi:hypothetical protein GF345_03745 [Candidatus Woesearchaeota archaeon]|nr:hypothetical protein [Candidatus Woesearchaeota archaeon]
MTVEQALEDYYNSRSQLSVSSHRYNTAFDNVDDILSRAEGAVDTAYNHLNRARNTTHEFHTDAQRNLDSKAEKIIADFRKADLAAADYVISELYGHDAMEGMPEDEKLHRLSHELDNNCSEFVRLYHTRERVLNKMPKNSQYHQRA